VNDYDWNPLYLNSEVALMLRSLILACGSLLLSTDVILSQSTEEEGLRLGTSASGMQGAVAAGGGEAVAIGLDILRKGGNAADSAAATVLALSVTDSKDFVSVEKFRS
jgi:gamma-glutamyltranspeptidase/glutathione hydrolase